MGANVLMITVQLGGIGFSNFYRLYVIERIQLHRNQYQLRRDWTAGLRNIMSSNIR